MSDLPRSCDILVVGSGNAGFSAAVSAKETRPDSNVILIDKCPEEWAGGNSYFTAGAMRIAHQTLEDLLPIVNNVDATLAKCVDLDAYTKADFTQDMERICLGRADPELSRTLIEDSNEAIKWLARNGVRFQLSFNRQAFLVDGRYKFWGGLALKTQDGGKGLMEDHQRIARRAGVKVFYSTPATALHRDPSTGAITAVSVEKESRHWKIEAKAVILAAGGFEANPKMRAQYLGLGWDLAYVRGTPYNSGDLLEIAVRDVSAKQVGHWSGCHCTCWDANAPADFGNRAVSNEYTKSGYPLGVMINAHGDRFVDEGIDFRNYTYAVFGRAILGQPNGIAFQIWDKKTIPWLRSEEYRDEVVQKIQAGSLEELAERCSKVGLQDREKFVQTLTSFNAAVHAHQDEHSQLKWNPAIKDGMATKAGKLALAKSNWALPIDEPPFLAVKVTAGITFTFGGLAVNPDTTAVSSTTGNEVPGLFCTGEILGGLFYGNYPGGSGLTSGAVFGRRAGRAAAEFAAQNRETKRTARL